MTFLLDNPWFAIVIPLALMAMLVLVMHPKVWIASFLISLPVLITEGGKGISATEALVGGFFTGSVVVWLVWQITTGRIKLVRNWFDVLILTFFIVSAFNVVLALSSGISLVSWMSEYVLFALMLYYFPLREYFGKDDESFQQMLLWFALASVILGFASIYNYKTRMAEGITQGWQFTASRSVLLGPISLIALTMCFSRFFHMTSRKRWGLILVAVVNGVALVLTFTRTLWVIFFLCVGLIMLFLTWKQNLRLISSLLLAAGIVVAGAYAYNPRIAEIALAIVTKRFQSSAQLSGGDHSFDTRVVEGAYAWRKIKQYPLGGSGLRVPFLTKTPISVTTNRSSFVHFGYLGLVYRLGFPIAFLMFFALGLQLYMMLQNAWRLRGRDSNPLLRSSAVGMLSFYPALLLVILVTGFFDTRYGNVMFGFIFACTGIVYDRLNK